MDASTLWNGLGKSMSFISGFMSSKSEVPKALPALMIDSRNARSPILTVIQIALLYFKSEGTKIFFIPNAIAYQSPGLVTSVSRTCSYYFDPQAGAGKEYLTNLKDEFDNALRWYPPNEFSQEIIYIYEVAKRGLKNLANTYEGSPLVTSFCEECIAKIDQAILINKTPEIQTFEEEGEEKGKIQEQEKENAITLSSEPKKPLSKKIKVFFTEDKIRIIHALFNQAMKEKESGGTDSCKSTVKSIQNLINGNIELLQGIIKEHYESELKLG